MTDYVAADGTVLTDAVIAELTQEAEQGFPHSELTAEAPPWKRPAPMETHSVRVPGELWSIVAEAARKQNMSTSEYTRLALLRSLRSA